MGTLSRRRSISTSDLASRPLQLELCLTLKQHVENLKRRIGGRFANETLGAISVPCPPTFLQALAASCKTVGKNTPVDNLDAGNAVRMVEELSPVGVKVRGLSVLKIDFI